MLAKAKKHIDRTGLRPMQFQCVVVINSVYLPACCAVPDQSILSVSFVKGTRVASTSTFLYSKGDTANESEMRIKERLELSLVLYKDVRSNKYQKKTSKLILRHLRKHGITGKYSPIDIGRCNLELHEIANELGYELTRTKNGTVVFENLNGAMVKFTIILTMEKIESTSRYLRNDEDLSTTSSVSELTDPSAANGLSGDLTEQVPVCNPVYLTADQETTLDQYPVSYTLPHLAPGWSVYEEMIPEEDERKSSSAESGCPTSPVQLQGVTAALEGQNQPTDPSPGPANTADDAPAADTTDASVDGYQTAAQGGSDTDNLRSAIPLTLSDQLVFMRRHRSKGTATAQAFALYDQELAARAAQIDRLERELAAHLRESHEQILGMRVELRDSTAALYKEQVARETVAEATHKGERQLLQALSEARQEAVGATARCVGTLADLAEAAGDLRTCRERAAELAQCLRDEMAVAQQAAAVAGQASLQRAEIEDENRQLLDMLIEQKMESANLSLELEKVKKEVSDLERQLRDRSK